MTSDLLFGPVKINWVDRFNSLYPARNKAISPSVGLAINKKTTYAKLLRRGGKWTGDGETVWRE